LAIVSDADIMRNFEDSIQALKNRGNLPSAKMKGRRKSEKGVQESN
jgi:hypothetical protein